MKMDLAWEGLLRDIFGNNDEALLSAASILDENIFDIKENCSSSSSENMINDGSWSTGGSYDYQEQSPCCSSASDIVNDEVFHFCHLEEEKSVPASDESWSCDEETSSSTSKEFSESTHKENEKAKIRMSSPFKRQTKRSYPSTSSQSLKLKVRKRKMRSNLLKPGSQLYQFILKLLDDENLRDSITWVHHDKGVFRIINQEEVAKMWGKFKNKKVSYESLSRGLRHYYGQGLMTQVKEKLHYQFTQTALDEWERIRDKESIEDQL